MQVPYVPLRRETHALLPIEPVQIQFRLFMRRRWPSHRGHVRSVGARHAGVQLGQTGIDADRAEGVSTHPGRAHIRSSRTNCAKGGPGAVPASQAGGEPPNEATISCHALEPQYLKNMYLECRQSKTLSDSLNQKCTPMPGKCDKAIGKPWQSKATIAELRAIKSHSKTNSIFFLNYTKIPSTTAPACPRHVSYKHQP